MGFSLTYSAPLLLELYSLSSWCYSLRLLLDSEQSAREEETVVFGYGFERLFSTFHTEELANEATTVISCFYIHVIFD